MNISGPFIRRPVATTLLTIAVAISGALAYNFLPVSPLPQVDFPALQVQAMLPGADPQTMASAVATPLERQFGRIAGVTEMTSQSFLGMTNITLVFDLNRNIDAAARDVQAAINAARGNLPTNLPSNPTYRKINPADAPIMILALVSDVYSTGRMYDIASSILSQKLSQMKGVGQVLVGGGALPGVRVEINPTLLNNTGLNLEDVRTALSAANANRPKGEVANEHQTHSLATTDQLFTAEQYRPLIVAYRNGAPVRVDDVAKVVDSVEDIHTAGFYQTQPSIPLIIFRQPGANIISTVDLIEKTIPQFQAEIPAGIHLLKVMDRAGTIRASVRDVELALSLSVVLVILVVFLFLRDLRTTLIPSVVVPVSLVGTFGVMYLCGYSLDNLSLMALAIATGFVVDDAIVVIENISRYLEQGLTPMQASLRGAREIGFTVLSISLSLVAVFTPILLMSGIVGRLFREFAVTLSVAIIVSLIVSLTTTPMMCAKLLKAHDKTKHGRFYRASEKFFDVILRFYEVTLGWVLRHPAITFLIFISTIGLTVLLFMVVPTSLFPQQDTGRLTGNVLADQGTSFQAMRKLMVQFASVVSQDPAVDNVIAFTGGQGGSTNQGRMFATLKPLKERQISADQVVRRVATKLSGVPGAALYMQAVQDLRIGGRPTPSQYQYTIQSENLDELNEWGPRLLQRVRKIPGVVDANSDQLIHGLQSSVVFNRDTASRLNISAAALDNVLYDAFGQRQVSTMYTQLNQYHVVMEVDPKLAQSPAALRDLYVTGRTGAQVPLASFAKYEPTLTPLMVNHSGQFPSITLSFNLTPGVSLGDAVERIQAASRELNLPASIHGSFSGTAQAYKDSLGSELILIIAALAAVYIVLGILYESYIHPITILSTLPSAGVGALLALYLTNTDLSVIAVIGIILLIGIVKKNAILMIDFAIETERKHGKSPREAIHEACLLRFRPITMTTMAALLGALPLALGHGEGGELRRPLGIAIVGGLLFSQALTLYTTPVIYLYLDRLRIWFAELRGQSHVRPTPLPAT